MHPSGIDPTARSPVCAPTPNRLRQIHAVQPATMFVLPVEGLGVRARMRGLFPGESGLRLPSPMVLDSGPQSGWPGLRLVLKFGKEDGVEV